jgi:outer membrane receptor for ferrienterochelin and colicins
MANALLDWQATQRLNAWMQGNYRSETSDYISRTSMSDGTPGYGFVDAGVVYKLTNNVDVKAGLYNIANKEVTNEDYEVVLDGRRLVVGMTVDF